MTVMVDRLSKFVMLEAIKSTDTAAVLKFLEKAFMTYGCPSKLVSDRGSAYTSRAFEKSMRERGVSHIKISTQHAQSNGQVERFNKEVARLLRSLCEKKTNRIGRA